MVRARCWFGVALGATLLVALPARASSPQLDLVARRVGQLEELLGQARFREAVARAPELRTLALALPPSGEARQLAIRTEVAAGTAALALRQEGAARECFARALRLDPRLRLDPSTPPKVRRTFEAVRGTLR